MSQVDLSYLQSIYISFLMRKDKLVKYFRELQIFKDDIQFPAEVCVSAHNIHPQYKRLNQHMYDSIISLVTDGPVSFVP